MSPEERQAENRRLLREARGASDRAPPPPSQFGAPVSPLSGVGGFPRSMASQLGDRGMVAPPYDPLAFQGVPRYEDLGPIQREEEGRRAYEMASDDYSMLPDELGLISPIASLVADPIADAIDVVGAAFGDPASRTRTMARHNRWGQGMGQVGEDLVDPGEGGNFLAQMLRDVPEGMRAEDEARASQFLPAKNGLDRAGDVLRGVWQGVPEYARDTRGRAAQSQALADYEARDAELAGARGEINAPWAEQVARNDARRAAGDDWWANAPFALEAIPGVGLIDVAAPIARSAGRAGLRAAGQDIPQMLARPVDPLHELGPMTNAYRNEGSLFRDAAEGGRNLLNNTPILRDVAPYAGDWIAGTWQGRAATVPLAAAGTFALSDEEDVGERLKDAAGVAGLAYLGGGLAGAVARTAPRALRDIEVSRATRMPERAPIDVDFSVYRPDEFTEVYVHPDGEIVAKYQGAFESGGGTGAEAVRAFRGMERALGEDIAAHQRPEYHWVPGPDGRPDPRLAEFYREAMRTHAPEGYVFSETPDGVMRLTRSEASDPLRNVNFGEQLNRDGSITPATPIESQGEPDFDLNDALGKITRNVNDDGSPYDDWIGLDGIVPDVGPTRREMLPELQRRQREIDTMAAQDGLTPPTLEGIIANPTQAQWDIDQYLGTFSAAPRHGKPRISSNMPLLGTALTAGAATGAGIDYATDGDFDFGEEAAAAALVGVGGRGLRGKGPRRPRRPAQVGNDALNANPQRVATEAGTNPQPAMRVRDGSGPIGNEAFHDPRLTPQQNRVVGMARNGMTNRQIADEELIDLAQVSVVFNGARKRAPDVEIPPAPKGNPGYNPRTGEPTATIQEIVKLRDKLVSEGYAPRAGPAGGESLYQVIGERLGISAKSVGMRLRAFDARNSDPLTGIALGTGVGAGGYALLSDEAGAEEGGQALEDAREAVRVLEENERRFANVDQNDPDSVRAAQTFLVTEGLYLEDDNGRPVRVDGVLGSGTRRAISDYLARTREDLTEARARLASAEADDAEQSATPEPWVQNLRTWGPLVAAPLAGIAAHQFRSMAVRDADAALAARNRSADALVPLDPLALGDDVGARRARRRDASNLNEFWERGGAGTDVPFRPNRSPTGFTNRNNPADAATLYPREPEFLGMRGNDALVTAFAGGEAGWAFHQYNEAKQEVEEARAAAASDPTRAHFDRLEQALNEEAFWDTAWRLGAGAVAGRVVGSISHPYSHTRPNVAAAEARQMDLNSYLRSRPSMRSSTSPRSPIDELSPAAQARRVGPASAQIKAASDMGLGEFDSGAAAMRALRERSASDPAFREQFIQRFRSIALIVLGGGAVTGATQIDPLENVGR